MRSIHDRLVIVRRKAASWRRRPLAEKCWFFPAFVLLGMARLTVITLPFRKIAPWLGHDMKTSAFVPLASESETARALHIGRAIRTAARYTPWQSLCLPQAMVARALLGLCDLPHTLFLGVSNSPSAGMAAHAWVCSGRAAVVGGDGFADFTVVGTFVSMTLNPSVAYGAV